PSFTPGAAKNAPRRVPGPAGRQPTPGRTAPATPSPQPARPPPGPPGSPAPLAAPPRGPTPGSSSAAAALRGGRIGDKKGTPQKERGRKGKVHSLACRAFASKAPRCPPEQHSGDPSQRMTPANKRVFTAAGIPYRAVVSWRSFPLPEAKEQ